MNAVLAFIVAFLQIRNPRIKLDHLAARTLGDLACCCIINIITPEQPRTALIMQFLQSVTDFTEQSIMMTLSHQSVELFIKRLVLVLVFGQLLIGLINLAIDLFLALCDVLFHWILLSRLCCFLNDRQRNFSIACAGTTGHHFLQQLEW